MIPNIVDPLVVRKKGRPPCKLKKSIVEKAIKKKNIEKKPKEKIKGKKLEVILFSLCTK